MLQPASFTVMLSWMRIVSCDLSYVILVVSANSTNKVLRLIIEFVG